MKIAIVVMRYGEDIVGGAEYHARMIAEHLKQYYQIDILTTCAKSYHTWANEYPEKIETLNGIRVLRFKNSKIRDVNKVVAIEEKIFYNHHTKNDELDWINENGPKSPGLIQYIRDHYDDYHIFIFFTFRYYTSYFGIQAAKEKAFLVPEAENDPALKLSTTQELFQTVKGIFYNVPEERALILNRVKFDENEKKWDIIGCGIPIPEKRSNQKFEKLKPYMLYLGRIEGSKGCYQLFEYYQRLLKENSSLPDLVLAGSDFIPIPKHKKIKYIGFVTESEKEALLTNAEILIMPSPYESLSLVTLEAMAGGVPVLVNGDCDVLKGHCVRSNAGLWYQNYEEFKECILFLLGESNVGRSMGICGKKYIEDNYSWDIITGKYRENLTDIHDLKNNAGREICHNSGTLKNGVGHLTTQSGEPHNMLDYMLPQMVSIFKCPKCFNKELNYTPQGLYCSNCKVSYPISNDVVDFLLLKKTESINEDNTFVSNDVVHNTIEYLSLPKTEIMFDKVKNIYLNSKKYDADNALNSEIRDISDRLGFIDDDGEKILRKYFFLNNKNNYCILFEKHYFLDPLPPNQTVFRNIRIKNMGDNPLSSSGKSPLYISYHLYDCNNNLIIRDGERTKLPIDIEPNRSMTIPLKVKTPSEKGVYILHICFVEENVRWFDEIAMRIPLYIDNKTDLPPGYFEKIKFSENQNNYEDDHKLAWSILNEYISKNYNSRILLLEIGGGIHPQSAFLDNCDVVNLDICPPLLELSSLYFKSVKKYNVLNVCADANFPPLNNDLFQGVVIFSSLHHFTDPEIMLKKLQCVLQKEGFVGIFCEPVSNTLENEITKRDLLKGINEQVFSIEEYLHIFLKAGYEPITIQVDGGSLKAILKSRRSGNPETITH